MPEVTPAQLALELRTSQKRIRDYLRSVYGTLSGEGTRWLLSEEQADRVRDHFGQNDESPRKAEWVLEPGDTVRRRWIHEVYGGQPQGGISTPRIVPEIFIFTDPVAGAKYGYDEFEGLREDGSYAYTGEGRRGPQTFVRGNRALRDAARDGKVIRLMRTKGVYATYVGAFVTDNPAYTIETIPDVDGNPRDGIIFNLLPLDALVDLLPAFGGGLEPAGGLIDYAATPRTWSPPEFSDVMIAVPEVLQGQRVVSRAEFELQSEFGAWLVAQGTPPKRLPLRVGSALLEPDFYVPDRGWIVEAKRSTARGHVRQAIGQVLDYVHVASRAGLETRPVLLLPGAPEVDLLELLRKLDIAVVRKQDQGFVVLT